MHVNSTSSFTLNLLLLLAVFVSCKSSQHPISDEEIYVRDNLCGTGDKSTSKGQLYVDKDFNWQTQGRTSFAVDWNLYCDREYLGSMIKSIYFGGAWLGLLAGGLVIVINNVINLVLHHGISNLKKLTPRFIVH